jgi:TRAP-type mannitol/chloroaromatic compound transport system substrate-binding protein
MRRRDILAGAGLLAAGSSLDFPKPALAQKTRRLKMVTDWPEGSPGLQSSAERLAQRINAAAEGRIEIEVFPAGKFVRALETFDAVGDGVADMYHSAEYYWERHSPAFSFFAAVPFGLTANELFAWVQYGGGQDLWDALSGQFNIKPFLCCNTGTQMGGWSTREIASVQQLKGLRYRMPGLGGEVLRRLGAIVVNVPGGGIVDSLKSGAIQGSEWVGPWPDLAMGLQDVATYYYYPGFHEPGTGITLGINKRVWESFDPGIRRLIEEASVAEYARSLAEFNAKNALSLRKLRAEGTVKVLKFDDSILKELYRVSRDVIAEFSLQDELSKKVYASYQQFVPLIMDWSDVAEGSILNSRRLA